MPAPASAFAFAIGLAAACLAGCGPRPEAAQAYAQGTPPRFEKHPCPSGAPDARTDCGTLIVPENRRTPVTREVRIAVAILRGRKAAPDIPPAIFLPGGPGEPCLAGLSRIASQAARVLDRRDVIVLDYRGVGLSDPVLDCGNPGRDAEHPRFLARCRERLRARGIDPGSYKTSDVAADIADLAAALGYGKVALIGNSYGTRVAFAVLRDHPGLAASAVLDAATPPEVDLFETGPAAAERAFSELTRACAGDSGCAVRHPDLEAKLGRILDRLAADPAEIRFAAGSGKEAKARITPALFANLLMQCFAAPLLPAVPALLDSAEKGRFGPLAALLASLASQPPGAHALGTYEAVQCAEEMPFNSAADARAIQDKHPRFAALSAYAPQAEACARWSPGPADPRENRPVTSPVPVLFLSGRFDPIVDPAWAEAAREGLPDSRHAVFPDAAHGALHLDCGWEVAAAFLDDPRGEFDACLTRERAAPGFLAGIDSAGMARAISNLHP